MIAFIALIYASFYFLVFGKGMVKKSARNMSIFVGVGVVLVSTIVFIWFTATPNTKDGRVFQYVIPIVPEVSGHVIEVPAEPLVPMEKGDVLFKIDPLPYQADADRLTASIEQTRAQQRLAQIEVDRNRALVRRSAGSQGDLDRSIAELDGTTAAIASLQAQLASAQWSLDRTVIRAPHSGYLVNLQVRPGVAVRTFAGAPAASFVSDETKEIVASFSQSSVRKIQVGNAAEMVFSMIPGEVFAGTVTKVVRAGGSSQLAPSGAIPVVTGRPASDRFAVRIEIEDPEALPRLPQGAGCTVTVYTTFGKPVHVIGKVVMRMNAWKAYLTTPI